MAPFVKIALIQMYSDPDSPTANFERASLFIRDAASRGANLAILPEYHISAWAPKSPVFLSSPSLSQNYLQKYCQMAKELNICIVPGTLLEPVAGGDDTDEVGGGGIANACYFIDNKGEILGRYQKKNLWHPERMHLTADVETPHIAFDTPLGKVGLLICWDLAFPEAFRELISQDAKLIICPAYWVASDGGEGELLNRDCEKVFLDNACVCRAFENTCAFAMVNTGAPEGKEKDHHGVDFVGVSQVGMPFLGALGKLGKGEGVSIVEVDMGVLETAEQVYKVREDMRTVDWHYRHTLRNLG